MTTGRINQVTILTLTWHPKAAESTSPAETGRNS